VPQHQVLAAGATLSLSLGPFEVVMLQVEPAGHAGLAGVQQFPHTMVVAEQSRRLALQMAEVGRQAVAWEALATMDAGERWIVRRALNGRAQYVDTEGLFRQSLMHADPRDRALTHRRLAGQLTLPPPSAAARLVLTAQLSRDGVFWHHHALFDIVTLQATLDGEPLVVATTPRRWHEQAGGWSWIAFSLALPPAGETAHLELEARACLPHAVGLDWQAWLVHEGRMR
jgi:hypothetical protein